MYISSKKQQLKKILAKAKIKIYFNSLNCELNPICNSQLAQLFCGVFKFCAWFSKIVTKFLHTNMTQDTFYGWFSVDKLYRQQKEKAVSVAKRRSPNSTS